MEQNPILWTDLYTGLHERHVTHVRTGPHEHACHPCNIHPHEDVITGTPDHMFTGPDPVNPCNIRDAKDHERSRRR